MLFSLLELGDRVARVRGRFRDVWVASIVGALLVVATIAFLVLESLWQTSRSRSTQGPSISDAAQTEA